MERLSLQSSMDIIRLRENKAYGEQKKKIFISSIIYIIRLNNILGKEYSFLADYIKEYCI